MLIARDTFAGTAGANLTSRTGELGATWAKQAGNTGDVVITPAGRIRGNTQDTNSNHYCSGVTASNEYDVEADFVVLVNVAGQYTALMGRMSTGAITDIFIVYSNGVFTLSKEVASVQADLGTATQLLTPGNSYRVKLQIRSALVKVFLDGVEIISASTPGDITGVGRGGVSFYAGGVPASTDSTGVHIDNFSTTDLIPETAWLPVVIMPSRRVPARLPALAVTAPPRLPGVASTVLTDSSWPTVLPRVRRGPAHPSLVAPLQIADVTLTAPLLSWQGALPALPWGRRTPVGTSTVFPAILSASYAFVSVINVAGSPTGDSHRAEPSMSVPYRPDLLQYQQITGPVLPITAGEGRLLLSMGVPYRLEILQYQSLVGPVRLADVTVPPIAWAPQLIQAVRSPASWGSAVSSGQSAPGPQ